MSGPLVIRAIRSVSASVSASRKSSAGSKRSPACAKRTIAEWHRWFRIFTFALAAYNLVRMRNLALAAP